MLSGLILVTTKNEPFRGLLIFLAAVFRRSITYIIAIIKHEKTSIDLSKYLISIISPGISLEGGAPHYINTANTFWQVVHQR